MLAPGGRGHVGWGPYGSGQRYRRQSMPGRGRSGPAGHTEPRTAPGTEGKLGVHETPPHPPPLSPCRALLHVAACAHLCRTQRPPECARAPRGLAELEQREGRVTLCPAGRTSAGRRPAQASSCSEQCRWAATGWHPELQAPGTGSPALRVQTCMRSPFLTPSRPTAQEPGPKNSPGSRACRVTGFPVT